MPSRTIRERFGNRTPNPEDAPPDEPLAGLRIAVDCGNGVGALATPQVLERLGADIVAINASVDGHFRAARANPRRRRSRVYRVFSTMAASISDLLTAATPTASSSSVPTGR